MYKQIKPQNQVSCSWFCLLPIKEWEKFRISYS